jgi:hypothetical protein
VILVPRQLARSGMTGDVPYYGGRFTPAQAYAAAHPHGRRDAAPPAAQPAAQPTTQPTSAAAGAAQDPVAALDHLLAAGVLTQEEHSDLLARVTA